MIKFIQHPPLTYCQSHNRMTKMLRLKKYNRIKSVKKSKKAVKLLMSKRSKKISLKKG